MANGNGSSVGVHSLPDRTTTSGSSLFEPSVYTPTATQRDGDGHGVLNLRGEPLPFLRLRDRFTVAGDAPAREHVLVVQHAGGRAGIAVDTLFGERQAVIKSLGTVLDGLSGVSGSTILGDGKVALILDVPALLREATGRVTTTTWKD